MLPRRLAVRKSEASKRSRDNNTSYCHDCYKDYDKGSQERSVVDVPSHYT